MPGSPYNEASTLPLALVLTAFASLPTPHAALPVRSRATHLRCALPCLRDGVLYLAVPAGLRGVWFFLLTLVVLGWVTCASSALAQLLTAVGDHLGRLNDALQKIQAELQALL